MNGRDRARRAAFGLLTFVLVAFAIEGTARLAYRSIHHRAYDRTAIASASPLSSYLPRDASEVPYLSHQVIHPYLGFVGSGTERAEASHGFYQGQPLGEPGSPDAVHVLLTGGSVAMQLGPFLDAALRDRLARFEPAPELQVFVAALGGFKQPQQLFAASYLQLVGYEFDLIVNLDGYNEIALPWAENVPRGVRPIFPRRWDYRIGALGSLDEIVRAGEIELLKRRRRAVLRFQERAVARSALVGLVTTRILVKTDAQIAELSAPGPPASAPYTFEATGTPSDAVSIEEVLARSAAIWSESSRLLDATARSGGASYLHVLQPNQYVPGSKPLSDVERRDAVREHTEPQDDAAILGYPLLRREGLRLAGDGVDFVDASNVFAHEARTTYGDPCCHLNELGLELLADVVADRAAAIIEQRRAP